MEEIRNKLASKGSVDISGPVFGKAGLEINRLLQCGFTIWIRLDVPPMSSVPHNWSCIKERAGLL